jgi:hypothetical protein
MHPLFLLVFVTLIAVIAFATWNLQSTRRHQQTGGNTEGLGGPNDPLSGANDQIRSPEEMRASMDAAAAKR